MPYADPVKRRAAKAAQARRRRARRRLEKAPPPFVEADQVEHDDPAAAVAEWASSTLIVPPGHPRAGEPMALPDYGVEFIRDALSHRESLLCVGRKNAKSAIVAILLLAHLAGPLRRLGWRAGVVSIDRAKAGELADQIENIANASEIQLTVRRSPRSVSSPAGKVDILSAEKGAGHASGFDLAIVDELGLLQERDRQLVAGMRSSVSARGGRFMALTIHGDGPFVPEILAREDHPSVAVHHFRPAADDCALDDEEAWAASNPGLGTIKSLAYMRDEARHEPFEFPVVLDPFPVQAEFVFGELQADGLSARLARPVVVRAVTRRRVAVAATGGPPTRYPAGRDGALAYESERLQFRLESVVLLLVLVHRRVVGHRFIA